MPFTGAHFWELLPLVLLALLFFGPKRLPEMGSAIGKTIKEFQKSMREVKEPETPAALPPAAAPEKPQLASPSVSAAAMEETKAPEVTAS
jgi:TatA/E family protein of Tat protein translocase